MSCLLNLCLFAWCPTYIVFCSGFCFVGFRLVYPVLLVSLDCLCFVGFRLVYPVLLVSTDSPCLIAPSIFSNVYSNELKLFLLYIYISLLMSLTFIS